MRKEEVDLAGIQSLDASMERLAKRVSETPAGEWIKGRGWNQELWPSRRFPLASDLDRVAPHHPVVLTSKTGHASVANSAALHEAGVTANSPDPAGGHIDRDESGAPNGMLFEEAMKLIDAVVPVPRADIMASNLKLAFEKAWQVGITSVHEMGQAWREDQVSFGVYQDLNNQGELKLRVIKYIQRELVDHALELGIRSGLGDDWLRVGGLKVYIDGALGARTAAMLEPLDGYPDNVGMLILEQEAFQDLAQRAADGGLALVTHAIGDRANRVTLDVLAAIQRADGSPKLRHRIEHVQVIHPDDIGRLAAQGVVASMQPLHAVQDAEMADDYWGERCATAYAWRSMLDAGTVLALGSDCPVEILNPFPSIHAAVTRRCPDGYAGGEGWYPEQRLTVEETVRGYTWGAAYATGVEDRLGTLSPGKLADLVVLDRDIFGIDPEAISETQVLGTMIGGEWLLGPYL
jgi:predicted amidohydrolase YtcJ